MHWEAVETSLPNISTNPLILQETAAPLGSATSFNDCSPTLRRPTNGRAQGGSTRHHVADTFKAQGDHFQGLGEPLSRPNFHPLRSPANGHRCARTRDTEMDIAAIAITSCVGLYLALRLTLRVYFPPDS